MYCDCDCDSYLRRHSPTFSIKKKKKYRAFKTIEYTDTNKTLCGYGDIYRQIRYLLVQENQQHTNVLTRAHR